MAGPTGLGIGPTGPNEHQGVIGARPINPLYPKTYPDPVGPAAVSPPFKVFPDTLDEVISLFDYKEGLTLFTNPFIVKDLDGP